MSGGEGRVQKMLYPPGPEGKRVGGQQVQHIQDFGVKITGNITDGGYVIACVTSGGKTTCSIVSLRGT